jgi:hypothetical protein
MGLLLLISSVSNDDLRNKPGNLMIVLTRRLDSMRT